MLVRFKGIISRAATAAMLCATMWAQAPAQGQAGQPQWKDRAEFDIYETIGKEADGSKRIALLNQWKEKYPGTEMKKLRAALFLQTYQALNQPANIYTAAKDVLAEDAADPLALSMISYLTPVLNNTTPEALDAGEKAANGMLGQLGTIFDPAKKPASIGDAQWAQQKDLAEAQSHKTLGWVDMIRKNNPSAQQHFLKSLEKNPAQGDVSYFLGETIKAENKVETYPMFLWHRARAVSYDGPGALPPQGRSQIDPMLSKAYAGFHGDASGLDELKKLAKTQALPPAGFAILSVTDVEKGKLEKEQAEITANPQLALWKRIKDELVGANGQTYFDSSMKDAGIPELTGTLVEQKSAKELLVAISDKTTPEVTLQFETPLVGKAEPGTQLVFTAVGKSYTKEPFMVMMEVERKDLKGWPTTGAAKRPAAAKRPGAAKRK